VIYEGLPHSIDLWLTEEQRRLYRSSYVVYLVLDQPNEDEQRFLTSLNVSCVLPSILVVLVAPGWAVSADFECFAVETIATLPIDEAPGNIVYLRNRVHWFNKRITKEMLPSLPSSRPSRPFIEAKWNGAQLERVSLVNFAGTQPHRQLAAAAELSKGVGLLFHRGEISTVMTAIQKRRGRRPLFESNEAFLTALSDVLREANRSLSVAQGLYQLSRHPLWQGQRLSLKECQEKRKTLRNWLGRCGLTWEAAKQRYQTKS
jgi:hypothetical protein